MHYNILPIGSVVYLKDVKNPMMICGYCSTGVQQPGYVYDYSGFPYPMGCGDTDKVYQFNNEHIIQVLALGYQDSESFAFLNDLDKHMEEIKKNARERAQKGEETSGTEGEENV